MAKPVPYLSAEWINAREESVLTMSMDILSHLIDQLSSSGYWPLEAPMDDNLLLRMTPEQLDDYIDALPTLEQKAAVINYLHEAGIPRTLVPNY